MRLQSKAALSGTEGSTMVEAAVVFPLVIMVVMLMLSFMVYLFDETASAASVRRAVIREAGRSAGTFLVADEDPADISVGMSMYNLKRCAEGEKAVLFRSKMPGVRNRSMTLTAHQYTCNERTQIRLWDLFQ